MKKILLSSFLLALFAGVQGQITLTNDIHPGTANTMPLNFQELNGKLYFSADDGINGRELWQYDPNTNTSLMVYNIGGGSASGIGYNLNYNNNDGCYVLNGKLYFTADDQANGSELWVYDGINSPSMVADIFPGEIGSYPRDYISLNNKLYFSGSSATSGNEIFVYDPVTNIAQVVTDINLGNSDPSYKAVLNNKIYFSAYEQSIGIELYVYDPSSNSTVLVSDIEIGTGSSTPTNIIAVNGKIYFSASTTDYGRELYYYTGLGAPVRITDLEPHAANGLIHAAPFVSFNGKLYFAGRDATHGAELFVLDILTNTAQIVYDINPGVNYSLPLNFCVYSGKLFFSATTASFGNELWSYDGVNTPVMVEDMMVGTDDSSPFLLKVMGDRLYFNAKSAANGTEVFYHQAYYASINEYNNSINTVAYPVPAQDEVHIRVTLEETASFSVNVYDITGKTVYTLPTTDYMMGMAEISIPLQTLAKGSYQYALIGTKGVMGTGKIIKQ